jgi:hypothetical protein
MSVKIKTEYDFKFMCYMDHTNQAIRMYIKWIKKNQFPYQQESFYEALTSNLTIRKRQIDYLIFLKNKETKILKNQVIQTTLNL